jgi:hypothetical protein
MRPHHASEGLRYSQPSALSHLSDAVTHETRPLGSSPSFASRAGKPSVDQSPILRLCRKIAQ